MLNGKPVLACGGVGIAVDAGVVKQRGDSAGGVMAARTVDLAELYRTIRAPRPPCQSLPRAHRICSIPLPAERNIASIQALTHHQVNAAKAACTWYSDGVSAAISQGIIFAFLFLFSAIVECTLKARKKTPPLARAGASAGSAPNCAQGASPCLQSLQMCEFIPARARPGPGSPGERRSGT